MLESRPESWVDLDPLIGRDVELANLLDELERSRLVSLTGPGGSGKTRLAEAVLSTIRERGRNAWFVDLSAIDDESLVGATIWTTLRLEGSAVKGPLDVVIDTLADRDAVLGLDNVEQITGIGQIATYLLRGAPGLRILTTSRIPLGVRGEVEVAVPTLVLPAESTVESVEQSPAGALFMARARAIGRLRTIDDQTASDIVILLHRLDGLPLAIELAAARSRAMSPAEIARRVEERGTEAIDSHDGNRHRSLRAILDWTLGLLSPAECETLEAVSVCAGFDLDLAQALAPEVDVVDAIESLITLGLVATSSTPGMGSRFRLLETIRTTVLRGLTDDRVHALEDRHAHKFLDMADDWDRTSAGGWTPDLVERLDAEADNIRRALDRLDAVDPRQSLVLGSRLATFWQTRGRLAEGLGRFDRTFALAPEPSVELARATALYPRLAQGVLGLIQLRALGDRAIELARVVSDPPALVAALSFRTIIAMHEGDAFAAAAAEAEVQSLDLTDIDARTRIALTELRVSAAGAEFGEDSYEYVAQTRAQLAEASNAGWAGVVAIGSSNLAQILFLRGEYVEAAELAGDSADTFRRLDNPSFLGIALSRRAAPLAEVGRSSEAVDAAIESAVIAETLRLPGNTADALLTAMPVALATGQPLLAARLWGAVRRMHEHVFVLPPSDLRLGEGWLARASTAATAVAIELALRDGEAEDPLELLRTLPHLLRGPTTVPTATPRLRHGDLTKREIEVLNLVGQGRSDPEIADALFISPKTASVHVANIKSKLGLQSRLEVALRARELGLVGDIPTGTPC
jgi:predicted ATPase/DNA-binding CsgD family transcriptional regulator